MHVDERVGGWVLIGKVTGKNIDIPSLASVPDICILCADIHLAAQELACIQAKERPTRPSEENPCLTRRNAQTQPVAVFLQMDRNFAVPIARVLRDQ